MLTQLVNRTLHAGFAAWVDEARRRAEKATLLQLAAGRLRNASCAKVRCQLPCSKQDLIHAVINRKTGVTVGRCAAFIQRDNGDVRSHLM